MGNSSDALKTAKRKNMELFFGSDLKMTSGKYFTFNKYIDQNNIIVLTNNVKKIKDNFVLFIGTQKGVFLKDWQVRKVCSYQMGINCYAVKLSRKYFKPYEFKMEFDDLSFIAEDTFDSLIDIAKEQDKENLPIKEGWIRS